MMGKFTYRLTVKNYKTLRNFAELTHACFVVFFQPVALQTVTIVASQRVVTQLRAAMARLCALVYIWTKRSE